MPLYKGLVKLKWKSHAKRLRVKSVASWIMDNERKGECVLAKTYELVEEDKKTGKEKFIPNWIPQCCSQGL